MAGAEQARWVVPNPQICRSFGLMNIIFGSLLLLFAVGSAVAWVVMPTFQKQMMAGIEKQQAERKAEREAKLAELKSKEAAAKTKEEKDALKDERDAIEKRVEPDLSAMSDITGFNIYSDKRILVYYIAEISAAIILNVVLIISGVGLLRLADWGRRMAIGVEWLKILRWLAMTIVTFVLILPITLELTQKAFEKMDQQIRAQSGGRAGPIPLSSLAPMSVVFGGAVTVFSAVVSSVYPALSIWFLTRPAARGLPRATVADQARARAGRRRNLVSLATLLLGHLTGPECRRALARGWLIAMRGVVGLLEALAVLALDLVLVAGREVPAVFRPVGHSAVRALGDGDDPGTDRRCASAGGAGGLACRRARARRTATAPDDGSEPPRNRRGSRSGQAEPGWDDPSCGAAVPRTPGGLERPGLVAPGDDRALARRGWARRRRSGRRCVGPIAPRARCPARGLHPDDPAHHEPDARLAGTAHRGGRAAAVVQSVCQHESPGRYVAGGSSALDFGSLVHASPGGLGHRCLAVTAVVPCPGGAFEQESRTPETRARAGRAADAVERAVHRARRHARPIRPLARRTCHGRDRGGRPRAGRDHRLRDGGAFGYRGLAMGQRFPARAVGGLGRDISGLDAAMGSRAARRGLDCVGAGGAARGMHCS